MSEEGGSGGSGGGGGGGKSPIFDISMMRLDGFPVKLGDLMEGKKATLIVNVASK